MKNQTIRRTLTALCALFLALSLFACTATPPNSPPTLPPSAEEGDGTPDGGKNTPDGGENTPDGGESTPDGGENTPDGGESTPDGGENTPDGGENTPDGGESTPDGGDDTPSAPDQNEGQRDEDGNARHVLVLPDTLPAGTYTLRYENGHGVMTDYGAICTLTKDADGKSPTYEGFIPENCAPVGAVSIGIYRESGERVGALPLGSLKVNLGEKLYSFGALSDVHIQSNTAKEDFARALTYLNTVARVNFITVAGDLTQNGTREELLEYAAFVKAYSPTTHVFEVAGNHEGQQKDLVEYIANVLGEPLYYAYYHKNDVFLMLGLSAASQTLFKQDALQWLYETLEKNRDKRCFVFQHVPSQTTSGAALGVCDYDIWDGADAAVFESLVKHYPNVTWFHGHSHFKLDLQNLDPRANYDGSEGFHSVHVPALATPEAPKAAGGATSYPEASEGYVIDVYENGILLSGRDFVGEQFLPVAIYYLDTTVKAVETGSYYDPTGTVLNENTNLLKPNDGWFSGASVDKNTITSITFAPAYKADYYDEKWAADVRGTGNVTVYRNGSALTVVGNEYGILAAPDSSRMLAGFTSLSYLAGLEYLNTDVVKSFDSFLDGCASLLSVDLSALSLSHVYNLRSFLRGCTRLEKVTLPAGIGAAVASGQTLYCTSFFEGCASLKTVDLSAFAPREGSALYFSSFFMKCSTLESVTLPALTVSSFVNAFYGCSSLKTLDLGTLDFSRCDSLLQAFAGCRSLDTLTLPEVLDLSRVKTVRALFSGCAALSLDCSGWVLPATADVTDFGKNAPGVTPPAPQSAP